MLADVCSQYASCRFDDYAVFNYQFSASEVSKLDYFHPSLAGQARAGLGDVAALVVAVTVTEL